MFRLSAAERDDLLMHVSDLHTPGALRRVEMMLDAAVNGTAPRPRPSDPPRQLATTLWMPDLPSAPWPDPGPLSWMSIVADAHPSILDDFKRVAWDAGTFLSYVGEHAAHDYPDGLVRGWQSYFFCRDGRWDVARARRCPAVVALIDRIPWFPGDMMFSVLAPGTEIPFHYGLDNMHLTLHLPLEVPEDCAMVVDGRECRPSQGCPLIFDDTFRHAAWNRGKSARTHLLVDIWHPSLTSIERSALRYLVPAIRRLNRASLS